MKEITFNIKLNENEYNLILQNKNKQNMQVFTSSYFDN